MPTKERERRDIWREGGREREGEERLGVRERERERDWGSGRRDGGELKRGRSKWRFWFMHEPVSYASCMSAIPSSLPPSLLPQL
jgi:hypothetical protein